MISETVGVTTDAGRHPAITGMIEESSCFAAPAEGIELSGNEVQVWLGDQNPGAERFEQFFQTLSAEEQDRALRFHFQRDRVRFVTAHGILRCLLGAFLKTAPDSLRFRSNEYGKPSLADEFSSVDLKFNISHSGAKVLMAFALDRELGVDIEEIRSDFTTDEIARRYFSPLEVATLSSLPESVRAEAFFNCWTRKEAYTKAIGEGLSCPLDGFDVTISPEEPARLLETRAHALPASAWAMHSLDAGPGYKAALVVEGFDWKLTRWRWPETGAVPGVA